MTSEERYSANENLIYHVLKKHYPSYQFNEDIQQEARIGLWKACINFDESRETTFSTFACQCIKNEVAMAFRRDKHIVPTESLNGQIYVVGDSDIDWCDYKTFVDSLTPIERKVCESMMLGYNQTKIANTLGYSRAYISRIVKNIREKIKKYA